MVDGRGRRKGYAASLGFFQKQLRQTTAGPGSRGHDHHVAEIQTVRAGIELRQSPGRPGKGRPIPTQKDGLDFRAETGFGHDGLDSRTKGGVRQGTVENSVPL